MARTVATRIIATLRDALERQRSDVRLTSILRVVARFVQDEIGTVVDIKTVQDVYLIVQGGCTARQKEGILQGPISMRWFVISCIVGPHSPGSRREPQREKEAFHESADNGQQSVVPKVLMRKVKDHPEVVANIW